MAKTEVIKRAILKNGKDFDKWIESTPSNVASIKKVRQTTKRIQYSMVEKSSK